VLTEQAYNQRHSEVFAAQDVIKDGLAKYRKKKLNARSKESAEDSSFAELDEYDSPQAIQDAYGWEQITDNERDRLLKLLDAREQYAISGKKYEDGVTLLLERAIGAC
jgi:hypothetical protein